MRKINEYILEKFKISKDSSISNYLNFVIFYSDKGKDTYKIFTKYDEALKFIKDIEYPSQYLDGYVCEEQLSEELVKKIYRKADDIDIKWEEIKKYIKDNNIIRFFDYKEDITEKFKISKDTNIKPAELIDNYSVGDICILLSYHAFYSTSKSDYILFNLGKIIKINKKSIILDNICRFDNDEKYHFIFKQDDRQDEKWKQILSTVSSSQISILIKQQDVKKVFKHIKENGQLNFAKLFHDNILTNISGTSVYKYNSHVSLYKRSRLTNEEFNKIEDIIKDLK